jgi:ferritin-like metal-binding protein YciE
MSTTRSPQDLLTVCIQDLHDGARQAAKRLPAVIEKATGSALRNVLDRVVASAERARAALAALGRPLGGPPNIWMAGILDDAQRDTQSVEGGVLLDLAMIGAVRKALAATLVSYETAIAVAGELGEDAVQAAIEALRDDTTDLDRQLRDCLGDRATTLST